MKFSESWLREWVNPKITREELCEKLTMAGLEIEELAPVSDTFSGVLVGLVLHVEKHPEADRLNVCQVDVGLAQPLPIVCGATNVKAGIKVPVAVEGALLPRNIKITLAKVRGMTSHGMLCTAHELGLAEESNGLFIFPDNAPVGKDVWDYLQLADYLLDVSITPNRGDCLSIRGMANEVAALTESALITHKTPEIITTIKDVLPVTISAEKECPRYVGRVIRAVRADASSPVWLQERLRRSGIRSISPIVDVTNFVMLELGQPMHAFSLDKIVGGIDVRMAKANETLKLLDGSDVTLNPETLVIADQEKPLAIAGVMGGLDSAVTLLTQDVFLESAYFSPNTIARAGRNYHLSSDSAYRFERGIDPTIQRTAIERATQLLLDIVGGKPGPVIEVSFDEVIPRPAVIKLRYKRVSAILGFDIESKKIENLLQRLGFTTQKINDGWQVTVPPRRSDIALEVDLIEEIARLYGYDNIPCHHPRGTLQINSATESKIPLQKLRQAICDLGYNEVVTYSFIDKKMQALIDPTIQPKELLNPITADMSVMRTSLWPGLITTLLYNLNRQQSRVRVFETGLRFMPSGDELKQERMLAGLVYGSSQPEQWGISTRPADFFDVKGDLQNVFKLTGCEGEFIFKAAAHSALHPGQTAQILRNGQYVGIIGTLHPAILQGLKVDAPVFVFELFLDQLESGTVKQFTSLSKFPEIRRDIALLIDQTVPAEVIQGTIKELGGELLKELKLFDVYQGKGIEPGLKSIAVALTLQHASRTLVDEEVADLMERVIVTLKGRFNAELRG
ncbi:MAG: phenylalanine--tRNA ligase subunit beta [Gammaproteobacteria bacterium]|nr:phenylalanine--tRNA ligase subunit beta [Gammaproteobacteria bacterium]